MYIDLEPVAQTGHNCKITAIAAIEKYFSKKFGYDSIPLHKEKKNKTSIRSLAKTKDSRQGELLELRQITDILKELGYEYEVIDFKQKLNEFERAITSNIKNNNLLIACFAVDVTTGNPTSQYNKNEHAAVIHGFNDNKELSITHWGLNRKASMQEFFDSSMSLPCTREREYYANIKNKNPTKKYDLVEPGSYSIESILPKENSGFQGKMVVVKQPKLENINIARVHLAEPLISNCEDVTPVKNFCSRHSLKLSGIAVTAISGLFIGILLPSAGLSNILLLGLLVIGLVLLAKIVYDEISSESYKTRFINYS